MITKFKVTILLLIFFLISFKSFSYDVDKYYVEVFKSFGINATLDYSETDGDVYFIFTTNTIIQNQKLVPDYSPLFHLAPRIIICNTKYTIDDIQCDSNSVNTREEILQTSLNGYVTFFIPEINLADPIKRGELKTLFEVFDTQSKRNALINKNDKQSNLVKVISLLSESNLFSAILMLIVVLIVSSNLLSKNYYHSLFADYRSSIKILWYLILLFSIVLVPASFNLSFVNYEKLELGLGIKDFLLLASPDSLLNIIENQEPIKFIFATFVVIYYALIIFAFLPILIDSIKRLGIGKTRSANFGQLTLLDSVKKVGMVRITISIVLISAIFYWLLFSSSIYENYIEIMFVLILFTFFVSVFAENINSFNPENKKKIALIFISLIIFTLLGLNFKKPLSIKDTFFVELEKSSARYISLPKQIQNSKLNNYQSIVIKPKGKIFIDNYLVFAQGFRKIETLPYNSKTYELPNFILNTHKHELADHLYSDEQLLNAISRPKNARMNTLVSSQSQFNSQETLSTNLIFDCISNDSPQKIEFLLSYTRGGKNFTDTLPLVYFPGCYSNDLKKEFKVSVVNPGKNSKKLQMIVLADDNSLLNFTVTSTQKKGLEYLSLPINNELIAVSTPSGEEVTILTSNTQDAILESDGETFDLGKTLNLLNGLKLLPEGIVTIHSSDLKLLEI